MQIRTMDNPNEQEPKSSNSLLIEQIIEDLGDNLSEDLCEEHVIENCSQVQNTITTSDNVQRSPIKDLQTLDSSCLDSILGEISLQVNVSNNKEDTLSKDHQVESDIVTVETLTISTLVETISSQQNTINQLQKTNQSQHQTIEKQSNTIKFLIQEMANINQKNNTGCVDNIGKEIVIDNQAESYEQKMETIPQK